MFGEIKMKCINCGKFMTRVGDWDEFPDGPYVNTEWKCVCGRIAIESDDYRLRTGEQLK